MRSPDDLLKDWGRQGLPVDDVAEERRAHMVSKIAGSIRETATERTRSTRRARIMIALVAAMLLLVTGVLAFATGDSAPSNAVMVRVGAVEIHFTKPNPAPPTTIAATEPEPVPAIEAPKKNLEINSSPPTSTTSATDLAEQNRLFASARAAIQRGDDRAALGELDRLLSRWPKSPLAPEARVERFRALKRVGDRAEAAREARRYLLEQKDGPAKQEARALALDPNQSLH